MNKIVSQSKADSPIASWPNSAREVVSLEGALARPRDPKLGLPTQISEIITRPFELALAEQAWRMLADWLDARGWSETRDSPFARNLRSSTTEFRNYAARIRGIREEVELEPMLDRVSLMDKLTPLLMDIDDNHVDLYGSLGEVLTGRYGEFSMLREPVSTEEEFMQRISFLTRVMNQFVMQPWREFYGRDATHLHTSFEKGPNHERHVVKRNTSLGTLVARLEFEDPAPVVDSFLARVPYPYESALFIRMEFRLGGALTYQRWRHNRSDLMRYTFAYGESFLPRDENSKDLRAQVRADFSTVVVSSIGTLLDVIGSFHRQEFDPYSGYGFSTISNMAQGYLDPAAHQCWKGPHKLREYPPFPSRKMYEGYPYKMQIYRCPAALNFEKVQADLRLRIKSLRPYLFK